MTEPTEQNLPELRGSLTELKREAAKVIARFSLGGDDLMLLEAQQRMRQCRARARELAVETETFIARLDHTWSQEAHDELHKAARFLGQMQRMGLGPNEDDEAPASSN